MSQAITCLNPLYMSVKKQPCRHEILQAATLIVGTCTALLLLFRGGEVDISWLTLNGFPLDLKFRLDHLSTVMLFVVSTIGFIVYRYASRYLLSDTSRRRFLSQVTLTLISVMVFTVSGNLLSAFIGWQLIGLNLYILLNHYHYQSAANRAAKKKFVINRIGDMCFLLAIILCFQQFGTTDYAVISQNISVASYQSLILGLVFIAVMTKSAQFPFHIWLPDTMQAPTPVSALMHAGVINSGGILLARLSPMINQSASISSVILMVGIVTLITGALFKITQTDVKRKLAYSTMSQMGYMVLQCGLGCYSAAVFHLIAHGFYKAFLFLNAGNALKEGNIQQLLPRVSFKNTMLCVGLTILLITVTQQIMPAQSMPILLWTFIGISIHCFLVNLFKQKYSLKYKLALVIACQLLVIGYILALTQFELLTGLENQETIASKYQYVLMVVFALGYIVSIHYPVSKIQSSQFGLKMYQCFKMKLYIEPFYRRYFLTPFRSAGEHLNEVVEHHLIAKLGFITALLVPIALLTRNLFTGSNSMNLSFVLLIITIALLTMANRAKSIKKMLCYLLMAQFNLIVLNLANSEVSSLSKSITLLIPYASLIVGIGWLFYADSDEKVYLNNDNKLTTWGTYLTVLLFLLIGLPGTFSFCLLFELIANSTGTLLNLFMILLTNIMISIVVLHLLQDYVFNLKQLKIISKKITPKSHIILLSIIVTNLLCGNFNPYLNISLL